MKRLLQMMMMITVFVLAGTARADPLQLDLIVNIDAQGLGTDCLRVDIEEVHSLAKEEKEKDRRLVIFEADIPEVGGGFSLEKTLMLDREHDHNLITSVGGCDTPQLYIDTRCRWRRSMNKQSVGTAVIVPADEIGPARLEIIRTCRPTN